MPDEFEIICPTCGAVFAVSGTLCGKPGECSACGAVFEIPSPEESPDVKHAHRDQAKTDDAIPDTFGPDGTGWRYAAFISYRHADLDRKWATWLHETLETYRIPKTLVKELEIPQRIGRCFRDEDELPASADLSQEIETALRNSKFLIVVCSPRTPSSEWVNKEVLRFREMGRDNRILALLVEGEPSESFPRALREIRHIERDSAGNLQEIMEEIEPLAADVRVTRPEPQKQLKRLACIRLIACILGCRFDDLIERDTIRDRRRRFQIIAITAGILLAMAGIGIFGAWRTYAARQKTEIEFLRAQAAAAQAETEKQKAEFQQRRAAEESSRAESEKQRAFRSTALTRFHKAFSAMKDGDLETANTHLDTVPKELRHYEWYYLKRRCTMKRELFQSPVTGVMSLCFSNSGQKLATALSNGTVLILDAATGKRTGSWSYTFPNMFTAALSPDGTKLLWMPKIGKPSATQADTKCPIFLWDEIKKSRILSLNIPPASSIGFTPDGNCIWYTVPGDLSQGYVVIVSIESPNQMAAIPWTAGPVSFSKDGSRCGTYACLGPTVNSGDPLFAIFEVASKKRLFSTPGESAHFRFAASINLNGDMVAVSKGGGEVSVYEVFTGRLMSQLKGHGDYIRNIQFSPDGARVLTLDADWRFRLFNPRDGRLLANVDTVVDKYTGDVQDDGLIAFSRDSRFFVNAGSNKVPLQVWDDVTRPETPAKLATGSLTETPISFSPDGRLLATQSLGRIKFWNLDSGQPADYLLEGAFVLLSPDWRYAVVGERNPEASPEKKDAASVPQGEIRTEANELFRKEDDTTQRKIIGDAYGYKYPFYIWEVFTWKKLWSPSDRLMVGQKSVGGRGQSFSLRNVAISPDSTWLAGQTGNEWIVWELANGKEVFRVAENAPDQLSFDNDPAPDMKRFGLGGKIFWAGGKINWLVKDGPIKSMPLPSFSFFNGTHAVAFTKDTQYKNNTANIYDSITGEKTAEYQMKDGLNAFAPDGSIMIRYDSSTQAAYADDIATGANLYTIQVEQKYNSYSFSEDSQRLIVGQKYTETNAAQLFFDPVTGQRLLDFIGLFPEKDDGQFVFSCDLRQLATHRYDQPYINIWGRKSSFENEIIALPAYDDNVRGVAFSPEGRVASFSNADDSLKIWDLPTQSVLHEFKGFFKCMAFSPDGKYLAACGPHYEVCLLDMKNGAISPKLMGNFTTRLLFSNDGRYLAAFCPGGNQGDVLRLFRIPEGEPIPQIDGKTRVVPLVFSEDSRQLICLDTDGNFITIAIESGKTVNSVSGNNVTIVKKTSQREESFNPILRSVNAVSRDGNWAVLGRELVNIRTGQPVARSAQNLNTAVCFHPDGKIIATCDRDKISLWTVPDLRMITTLQAEVDVSQAEGQGISFSSDGRRLAFAGKNGKIIIWPVGQYLQKPGQ